MAGYTAIAVSEGDHWVVDVPGIGSTQAGGVEELRDRVVELVVAMTHCDPEEVVVDVQIV
ncbi:hypothetical protein [Blastococcus sp. PRF04-17]|uniref:hypothetical protein n=1 Tax=Blastococcus sp. PRF04-17 TaxID=2933797 RepID=UPI001FF6E8FA|nr:hypothetical protein [Blastococcus sp. PRF04-17]UOY02127.1 hypothetical protein MVA48_01705 [Blastococcus sp. PRF04-17]